MRILYVASSAYPGDSAYSTRIDGLCKAFQLVGVQTDVLTDYSNIDNRTFKYHGSNVHVGAKHVYNKRTVSDKLFASFRMLINLDSLLQSIKYDCVIMSSMYMRVKSILKRVHKYKIPIILESCEWFESYNWSKQEKSIQYKKYVKAWDNYFIQADGVIAISRLLEEHYKEHISHIVRIPTVMDVPDKFINTHRSKPIKLIFTGSIAWGKDRLKEVVYAVDFLCKEGATIILEIFGPSKADIINQLENDSDILLRNENAIIIHGRIPHDEIRERCSEADFGVILRPNRRQSNAGFPTKLAEYMSVGTSVIANDTGDIALYVNNNNGFLLPTDFTTDDVIAILKNILSLDQNTIDNIKRKAYETATNSFNYNSHSNSLKEFLEEVVSSYNKK